MDRWPSNAELEALVHGFETRTLPKPAWTHEAHVAVGTWHIHTYGAEAALDRLRNGILRLNDAHGTLNTETSGYHETVTAAYVKVIANFLRQTGGAADAHEGVRRVLASPLAAKDMLLRHYSRELLFSPLARAQWVEPDRRPLNVPDTGSDGQVTQPKS